MVRAGRDFPFSSGAHHVARAVLIRAEKRAAAMDALFPPGSRGSNGVSGPWDCERCFRRGELRVVIGTIPVAHPFPDIAAHVVEPVAIRRKLCDRRDSGEPSSPAS